MIFAFSAAEYDAATSSLVLNATALTIELDVALRGVNTYLLGTSW